MFLPASQAVDELLLEDSQQATPQSHTRQQVEELVAEVARLQQELRWSPGAAVDTCKNNRMNDKAVCRTCRAAQACAASPGPSVSWVWTAEQTVICSWHTARWDPGLLMTSQCCPNVLHAAATAASMAMADWLSLL